MSDTQVQAQAKNPRAVSGVVVSDRMSSLINTGMCCLPLWMAMVKPTISGITIERRDQVLIGRRSLLAAAVSTFFSRWVSTNGPLNNDRGTYLSPFTVLAQLL